MTQRQQKSTAVPPDQTEVTSPSLHMVVLSLAYLGNVHLVVVGSGSGGGAHAEVPGAVLPELLPDELLVDEGSALELREHQPRHEQQLHWVPDRYPVQDRLGDHLQEGDEGVNDPVGQPLLVVYLGRALHRAHRRVQRVQQGNARPGDGVEVGDERP
uniref:Uncharacterized protein n=1 Tax=Arundo donax TaxID=35708 RepID=A0A0A9HLC6_ARUDO